MKNLLIICMMLMMPMCIWAGDDIMITRDGAEREVKIDRISNEQVIFTDLKKKKRGKQSLPTTFVYLIKTEKRGNIFFDEQGNQITRKQNKVGKKDEIVYLTTCEEVVAYDLVVTKENVQYKEIDKKKAPYVTKKKSEVFMICHADGSKDLFSGVKTAPGSLTTAPVSTGMPQAQMGNTVITASSNPPQLSAPTPTTNKIESSANVQGSAAPILSQQVGTASTIAGSTQGAAYHPALDTDPQTIINKVYAANPYALHRKGAIAEYKAKSGDKDVLFIGTTGNCLHITVADETVSNGVVRVTTQYSLFNKHHEPSKGISSKWKDTYYLTEIDTSGTYHLTNDILSDLFVVTSRQGYAALIPGKVENNYIKTNKQITNCSFLLGGTTKIQADYSQMRYEGEERVTTPAGTFDCIKISGNVATRNGRMNSRARFTWWLARNVGFVRIDSQTDNGTIVYYLNALSGI